MFLTVLVAFVFHHSSRGRVLGFEDVVWLHTYLTYVVVMIAELLGIGIPSWAGCIVLGVNFQEYLN